MKARWDDPEIAAEILASYKSWAVVGCSNNADRPSHGVATFLHERGYDVTCVNPNYSSCVEGLPCAPDLRSIEGTIEVVDIFRRPDQVEPHIVEAIDIGAKAVWMQLGVINEKAAQRAADAGLRVVMDRCPRIDLS